jgi:hypothetical protein
MTERDQLARVCRWNHQLSRENTRLRAQVGRARQEVGELEATIAQLQVEAEAADTLLGAAMAAATEAHTE